MSGHYTDGAGDVKTRPSHTVTPIGDGYNPDMGERTHLLDLDLAALEDRFEADGLPRYRARQVLEWVYHKFARSFDEMTNLPLELRTKLAGVYHIRTSTVARRAGASDGVVKWLLQWPDGAACECVLIPDGDRRTACISSQVGCPVGCVFCASGLDGLERNLTCGQIVEQALLVARVCALGDDDPASPADDGVTRGAAVTTDDAATARLSNVVFMGAGEPLANYGPVLRAIRTLHADWGLGLGARRITLSTVGLPSQIRRLADENLPINLALSLHAPNEALRRRIIPWAALTPLSELIDACRHYFERSGREITLEYILLGGVNDGASHAEELARFTRQVRCNVNLIRYNPVDPLPYARPTAEAAKRFQEVLRARGVNAHLRRSRGLDIDAACGQLRRRTLTAQRVQVTVAREES